MPKKLEIHVKFSCACNLAILKLKVPKLKMQIDENQIISLVF